MLSPMHLFAFLSLNTTPIEAANELPARYYHLMGAGITRIEARLAAEPDADLQALESRPGWRHFPSAVLVAATLYTKSDPANPRVGDSKLLTLAKRIGDLLTAEQARGRYATRL